MMSLYMHRGLATKCMTMNFFQFLENFRCDAMTDIMLDVVAGKMLEWKEHEHELNYQAVLGDQETMDALCNCHLLKFFMCPGMQAQPMLLERLVPMWDTDSQVFMVRTKN